MNEVVIETLNRYIQEREVPEPTIKMLKSMVRELIACKKCMMCRKENQEKALKITKRKLQVGCGHNLLDDFVNLDMFDPADIIWDVRTGLPFKDGVFDVVFSEHFLEHIDFPDSVILFLKESYRVLANGGKIIIGIPDTGLILDAYARKDTVFFENLRNNWYAKRDCLEFMNSPINCINYHMRDQLYHEQYSPHLWGYSEENLRELMEKYAFKHVRRWDVNEKWVNPKRVWGSLYLIGEKSV